MKYHVMSDIHGMWASLRRFLEEDWNGTDQVIVMGDLVDRGPDSFSVVSHLMNAVKEDGVIVLKGNHEDMLLHFLDDPINESRLYLSNGGWHTIKSFLPDAIYPQTYYEVQQLAERMKKQYPDEIAFLRGLPYYHETEHWIFVHAGINTHILNWKDSTDHHFLWSREEFLYGRNETGKRIYFGHTPTRMLYPKDAPSDDPFVFGCDTKVCVDGAAAFPGGQLNVVHLDDEFPDSMCFTSYPSPVAQPTEAGGA